MLSKYQGESEKYIRSLFSYARSLPSAIIFFDGNVIDLLHHLRIKIKWKTRRINENLFHLIPRFSFIEFDSVAISRGGVDEGTQNRRILAELLLQLSFNKESQQDVSRSFDQNRISRGDIIKRLIKHLSFELYPIFYMIGHLKDTKVNLRASTRDPNRINHHSGPMQPQFSTNTSTQRSFHPSRSISAPLCSSAVFPSAVEDISPLEDVGLENDLTHESFGKVVVIAGNLIIAVKYIESVSTK